MKLLPHQIECVEKFRNVKARLVGDAMGVGKTVEGVGLDLDLREVHGKPGSHIRTLIVCQKNGLSVWERHLVACGVPNRRILTINPKDRGPFEKELAKGAWKFDYYIVHWDVLAKLEDLNRPKHIFWHHVIADEAHLAKNAKAARTRELKKIKCGVKTALTGTPADNKPQDLWSILNWLYPNHYTSYWRFFNTYLEWNDWSGFREVTGVKNLDRLHEEIEPFYIRRTLRDVRADMPPKTYSEITVELTDKQRKLYNDMSELQLAALGVNDNIVIAPIAIAVLQRQQKMALGTCKVTWTQEEWDDYHDRLIAYSEALNEWEMNDREGAKPESVPGPKLVVQEPSPKIDALFELIEDHEEEQFVVFTNFSDVADLVEERCQRRKIPVSKITGAVTNQKSREEAVSRFQSGTARVFVGTIGAAGTTITLNAAHTAVFLDRDWNPSKNAQAEDRIYRIDNDAEPVQIIDIVAKDTVDEYRNEKIGQKASWLRDLLTPRN